MEVVATLRGVYSPRDYFKEPIYIPGEELMLAISDGHITATLKREIHDPKKETREIEKEIEKRVGNFFQLSQKQQPYQFTIHEVRLTLPNGTLAYGYEQSGWSNIASIQMPDTPETIAKRAQDELEDQEIATRAAKFGGGDAILQNMISSYIRSKLDRANKFFHLYDVKDTLRRKFRKNDWRACNDLEINKKEVWDRLEKLTNSNTHQSRHRGLHEELRNARPEELEEARVLTKLLINKYIDYLIRIRH